MIQKKGASEVAGNDFVKNQMNVCLSCRKGQKIIRDYKTIYKMHIEKYISSSNIELVKTLRSVLEDGDVCEGEKTLEELKKNYNNNTDIKILIEDTKAELTGFQKRNVSKRLLKYDIKESEKQVVEDLASVLNIEGSLIKKYETLLKLSSEKPLDKDMTECFKNLSFIIRAIKPVYKDETDVLDFETKYEVDVLCAMNERNKQLKNSYKECDIREEWERLGKKEKEKTNREETKKKIKYIFEQFCTSNFPKYKVENDTNCNCQLFLEIVKNIDESKVKTENDFYKRINNLSETNQTIICDYLFYAPKKFGSNLQRIMLIQDMSERFISALAGIDIMSNGTEVPKIRASTIQSLLKCNTPSIKKEYFERICKILLVSENVLKTGVGKRYGNWKDFFNEECIKEMKESDDFPNAHTDGQAKKNLKEEIQEIVEMDNAGFDEFLKKNEEYLYGEDCVLYETEWECFEALLNQDEFYTLLEVLERQS